MTLLAQSGVSGGTGNETGFIFWSPFTGETALLLALLLFLAGASVILLGIRLNRDVGLPRPWRWLQVVIVVVWALQILILLKVFKHISTVDPSAGVTGPVLPVTLASAACTFALVAYALRRSGAPSALGAAVAATFAGPMVFELPFILIVGPGSTTPTDPGATLSGPFFLAMFTTLAFLSFSSKAAISRYTLYFLGAMFLTFSVWALFGFAYPSDPTTLLLNAVSKVFAFAVTASMFVRSRRGASPRVGEAPLGAKTGPTSLQVL